MYEINDGDLKPFQDSGCEYVGSNDEEKINTEIKFLDFQKSNTKRTTEEYARVNQNDGEEWSDATPSKAIKPDVLKASEFFNIVLTENKRDKIATCKLCKTTKIIKMKNRNTSGLNRHLESKHPQQFELLYAGKKRTEDHSTSFPTTSTMRTEAEEALNVPSSAPNFVSDESAQKHFEDILINFVVKKYLPFDFFEDEVSTELFAFLNDNFVLPNGHELRDRILHKSEVIQTEIKLVLARNTSKISLTVDSCTSVANRSFCGVTCHFIDSEWDIKSILLDFIPIYDKQNGKESSELLYNVLKFYGLENKIQGITIGDANFKFLEHLQALLGCDFDSKENYFVCFGNLLNLAAQDFIKALKVEHTVNHPVIFLAKDDDSDISDSEEESLNKLPVNKVRSLLKKIKKSEQLQIEFNNYCNTMETNPVNPIFDVRNPTFEMLNWAMNYKLPLNIMCDTNVNMVRLKLDEQDWILIESIVKYLKGFKTLANMLSGEKYCTLSTAVLGINILVDKLEKWALGLDTPYKTPTDERIIMALNAAKDKILQHYAKTNWICCSSLILDPRHKKEAFQLTAWGRELEELSLKKFKDIYKNRYFIKNENHDTEFNVVPNDPIDEYDIDDDYDLNFCQVFIQEKNEASSSGRPSGAEWCSELNNYFLDRRMNENTDVLNWWRNHTSIFPNLSRMARDFLSTTPTTMPTERFLSSVALVTGKHRNSLNSESVRSLLCLNSWLDVLSEK